MCPSFKDHFLSPRAKPVPNITIRNLCIAVLQSRDTRSRASVVPRTWSVASVALALVWWCTCPPSRFWCSDGRGVCADACSEKRMRPTAVSAWFTCQRPGWLCAVSAGLSVPPGRMGY
jgi:hypothetical protein